MMPVNITYTVVELSHYTSMKNILPCMCVCVCVRARARARVNI
jgi:hypothetical protein